MSGRGGNPWMQRRVINWGHQGGDEGHRPNTIPAFRAALDGGAHALEFDVHLTADGPPGRLVVFHDPTIRSRDGSEVEIESSTLGQLRDERPDIPTLDEVLEQFPGVPMTVEIKAPRAAAGTARLVADSRSVGPTILVTFNGRTVREIREAHPGLDTAPGRGAIFAFWVLSTLGLQRLARRLGRDHVALQAPYKLDQVRWFKRIPGVNRLWFVTSRFVSAAHELDLAVHVWTVNEEADMVEAVERGVDGIMTDKPTLLADVLLQQGASWSEE